MRLLTKTRKIQVLIRIEQFKGYKNRSDINHKSVNKVKRDEIFVATKSGYVPDDADNGIPATVLIDQLIE